MISLYMGGCLSLAVFTATLHTFFYLNVESQIIADSLRVDNGLIVAQQSVEQSFRQLNSVLH